VHCSFCTFPTWKNFLPKQYENSGHDFSPNKYVFASKSQKLPICSICYQCNSNETELAVCKGSSPRLSPPWIRILTSNSTLIHKNVVGNDVTLQLQCRLTLAHITRHDATSWLTCYLHVNQYEFYGVCCDCKCFTLILVIWSSLCENFVCFLFTSNCLCVCVCVLYSFHRTELLIFKHMISMATRSRTSIICKLFSVQKKLDVTNIMDAIKRFPCRKNHLKALHFHVNLIYKTHWKLKNVPEKGKNSKLLYGRIRIHESSWKTRIFIDQLCIWENLLHSRICQNC